MAPRVSCRVRHFNAFMLTAATANCLIFSHTGLASSATMSAANHRGTNVHPKAGVLISRMIEALTRRSPFQVCWRCRWRVLIVKCPWMCVSHIRWVACHRSLVTETEYHSPKLLGKPCNSWQRPPHPRTWKRIADTPFPSLLSEFEDHQQRRQPRT